MIIKKPKYKTKLIKQNILISDAIFGCDECRKKIKEYPNESSRLEIKVFYSNSLTNSLHFCSWSCVFNHLPKIKTDYFISLPFVYFEENNSEKNFKELIRLTKTMKTHKK